MPQPRCLSELAFASLLKYSPDGMTEASVQSQEHTRWIKKGSTQHVDRIGLRAAELAADGTWGDLLTRDTTLVPVPRSQPFKHPNSLWPAMRIAQELCRRGLGCEVRAMLERREPIEKSALQRVGAMRPGPEEHIRTIEVLDALSVTSRRIVLVDDVVTRGATLLGCATVLRHALPAVEIRAFAVVRTMSGKEVESMLDPVQGMIRMQDGKLIRRP